MHWCNISDTTIELSLLSVSFICRFFSSLNSVSALSVLVFWSCSGYSLSSLIRLDHEIKLVAGYQHITSTTSVTWVLICRKVMPLYKVMPIDYIDSIFINPLQDGYTIWPPVIPLYVTLSKNLFNMSYQFAWTWAMQLASILLLKDLLVELLALLVTWPH